jgi:hypothetical protein
MIMNLRIFGESIVAAATILGICIALSSGQSNADDGSAPMADMPAIRSAAALPPAPSASAVDAIFYNASGEGHFTASGDLVTGQ